MKVAVAQVSCALGNLAQNFVKVREFATRAKEAGAELVVFPEMTDTGYSMPVIQATARSWGEGMVPQLQELARQLSIVIVSGVSERENNCIYNTQVAIDATGAVLAKYRKTHLFAVAPIEEQKCFTPGSELVSFSFAGFQVGLSICYDLRFPEVYRLLALNQQVNVFIISSAWPFPRVDHLRTLALARAIENQSYLVLANRVGTDAGTGFCGTSIVVDPYGVVLASASSNREELIQAELSTEVVKSVRDRMPVFADRRPALYQSDPA